MMTGTTWVSGFRRQNEDYRNVSRRLASYSAETVPEILRKSERAMLVYAGGDDVLAFLPLEDAWILPTSCGCFQ